MEWNGWPRLNAASKTFQKKALRAASELYTIIIAHPDLPMLSCQHLSVSLKHKIPGFVRLTNYN